MIYRVRSNIFRYYFLIICIGYYFTMDLDFTLNLVTDDYFRLFVTLIRANQHKEINKIIQ